MFVPCFYIHVRGGSHVSDVHYGPITEAGNAEHFLSMGGFDLIRRYKHPRVHSEWHGRDGFPTVARIVHFLWAPPEGEVHPAVRLGSSADVLPV